MVIGNLIYSGKLPAIGDYLTWLPAPLRGALEDQMDELATFEPEQGWVLYWAWQNDEIVMVGCVAASADSVGRRYPFLLGSMVDRPAIAVGEAVLITELAAFSQVYDVLQDVLVTSDFDELKRKLQTERLDFVENSRPWSDLLTAESTCYWQLIGAEDCLEADDEVGVNQLEPGRLLPSIGPLNRAAENLRRRL
ncbi:TagF domain-containing protein [Paraferrimonas sedimenticola]|uniref:Uncharacterized protein n=1 Tax=Paraferrimonas sedimenticola TaxID=375674 RepID=A0AA37RY33_9GAMM|nr:TagF domain-containing protein [Paraferrimonas sedimenticola]GLP96832.1 hypothetical protein GCM10007895_21380 [Paraferrimonas sedimenticola]